MRVDKFVRSSHTTLALTSYAGMHSCAPGCRMTRRSLKRFPPSASAEKRARFAPTRACVTCGQQQPVNKEKEQLSARTLCLLHA